MDTLKNMREYLLVQSSKTAWQLICVSVVTVPQMALACVLIYSNSLFQTTVDRGLRARDRSL